MRRAIGRCIVAVSWRASRRSCVLLLSLTLLAAPAVAFAHAELLESDPAAGTDVKQSPERVIARFSDELQPAGSNLTVVDGQGRQVSTGTGGVDLNDPDHTSMIVVLPPGLRPGTYTARWIAVSDRDGHQGHETRGSFTFTVQ
jgi:methionine-rich copper-binding protein CopC